MAGPPVWQSLGRGALDLIIQSTGILELLARAFGSLPALAVRPVRQVFYRQIYFTGVKAVGMVTAIGALLGIAVITQVSSLVGQKAEITGRVLVWVVVRELGPLFTAVIVIARSCTAVAAELGSMKVSREMKYLRALGIDQNRYLIMPRVAGLTLSLLALMFYFQTVAVFGGLAVSAILARMSFVTQLRNILASLGVFEIGISLVKGLAFGLIISSAACFHGLRVRLSITEVPQVTTSAVMQSLTLVVLVNGLITVVSFL